MSGVNSVNYQNPVNHSKKSVAKKALKATVGTIAIATAGTVAAGVALAYGSKTGKFDKLIKMAENKNFFKSMVGKGAKGLNSAGDFIQGKAESVISKIVTKQGKVFSNDKPMFKQLFESFHMPKFHKAK